MAQKIITQTELEDRVYRLADATDDLLDDIRHGRLVTELEEEVLTIDDFRRNVLLSIPRDASLKFREDVERWLSTIKAVY